MRDTIDIGIVAGAHVPAGLILQGALQPGDVLRLEPEPDNPYDKDAIKVLDSQGRPLGYVPNRGTHCGHCFEQVNGLQCPACGAGEEMIRSGGHASRIRGLGWLEREIAVIVREVRPWNKSVVAHATIYVNR